MTGRALGIASAAVVAVVIVAAGAALLGCSSSGGVGTPELTPPPSATPMPFPTDTSGGVPVAPGAYELMLPTQDGTGAAVSLRITFTVPAGWEKNTAPTTLWHATDDRRFGFQTVDNLYVDPCRTSGSEGLLVPRLGPTVDDLVADLRKLPDVAMTPPSAVTIDGFDGTQLALTASSKIASCVDGRLNLWTGPQGSATARLGAAIEAGEQARLLILDVDGVRLVVGQISGERTTPTDQAEVQTIVDSVRIERLDAAS